jgi:hypothetical protein
LKFGPGDEKDELENTLRNNLVGRIIGVEKADKMTVTQISEKVRRGFHKL